MRYLITAQSPNLVIRGIVHARGGEIECDRDERWERLGWVVPALVKESAPADAAPVEAPRPPRSRKAAPVPAVPPADDDAPASEVG